MKLLRIPLRLCYIAFVLARYRIDELILHSAWFYPFRFLSYFNPMHYLSTKHLSSGERLCLALERLGPIFIKFGQLLSTRRDLLSPEIAEELNKLQDNVAPFPANEARKIIESSLGGKLPEFFAYFSNEVLASASIAQVHSAQLLTGEKVVVKVLRPKIKDKIAKDLEILKIAAKLANHFLPNAKRLRPMEVVQEFELTLNAEINLAREASNASLLRRNFLHSDKLYIPAVYWDLCKSNVMVMEEVDGIPINDIEAVKAQGSDFELLAKNGLEIFFTQVFRHNFFHADMHPGNFFVSRQNKHQYIAVDFGIVGSLSESDRRYIAENLLAFFKRDYRRVAQLHIESGWVDCDVRLDDFEAAIRTVSEPVFERPLKEISMGQVIMNLFKIARAYNFTIQPQLILLQKSLFHMESLARNLYPELDLWKTTKPYLERWLREQVSPKTLFKKLRQSAPKWLEQMPEMPDLIHDTLVAVKENKTLTTVQTVTEPKPKKITYVFWGASVGLFISSALSMYQAEQSDMIPWVLSGIGVVCLVTGMLTNWFGKRDA